jgi:hypothetical protein
MEQVKKPSMTQEAFAEKFGDPANLIFKGQCYDAGVSARNCAICNEAMQYCYVLKILGDDSGVCPPEVGKLCMGECCLELIRVWNLDLYHELMVASAYLRIVTKATERDQRLYGTRHTSGK